MHSQSHAESRRINFDMALVLYLAIELDTDRVISSIDLFCNTINPHRFHLQLLSTASLG